MTFPSPPSRERVAAVSFRLAKRAYQLARIRRNAHQTIVFVLGYQRSGTTLMMDLFEKDLDSRVYLEGSKLFFSKPPNKQRLIPLDAAKSIIDDCRASLVVVKPLVESQNARQLLDYFAGSKALWMYRHYKDVAMSHIAKWGVQNGVKSLRRVIENNPRNWRAQNVPESVRGIVRAHFSEDMNPYDASALFWFVRNRFFFELNLDGNPRVRLCRYEHLVADPIGEMKKIYAFVGRDFPGESITRDVHTASLGKGRSTDLSPRIESLCQELLEKLDLLSVRPLVS